MAAEITNQPKHHVTPMWYQIGELNDKSGHTKSFNSAFTSMNLLFAPANGSIQYCTPTRNRTTFVNTADIA